MRTTTTRSKLTLLFMTFAMMLALPATVFADNVSNNLDNTVDAVAEAMPLNVGGPNGSTQLYIDQTNGDGKNGCNFQTNESLTLAVSSSNTGVATVSPSSVKFTNCGETKTLTVTPVAAGSTTISVSQTSNNTGGSFNLAPATFTVNVSAAAPANTAPQVTVDGVDVGASYDKGSVPAATCKVTDAEDGPSSFAANLSAITGPYTTDGIGSQTASCSYTDRGGLNASSSETYSIVDPSAPVITKVVTPGTPDGSNGWYKGNVTVEWTVSDPQSPNSLQKTGCVDQNITSDQAATTYSCSATSAGGSAGPESVTIKRDGTAPMITLGSASGTAGDNGWYKSAVSQAYGASDATSGLANPAQDSFSKPSGAQQGSNVSIGSGDVSDNAGNTASRNAGPFKIDLNAPVANCDNAPAAWSGTDVSIRCQLTDEISGLANAADRDFNLSTSVANGVETSNASTGSRVVADAAGHTVTAGPISGIKVDKQAPGFSCPADDGTWHAANQTFNCTASDNGSGLNPLADANFTLSTNVAAGVETSSASTGSKLLTDAVGNSVTAPAITGIKVDRKAPGLSYVGQTAASANFNVAGSNGWFVSPVQVEFSAADGGSGLENGVTSPFTRDSGAQQGSAVTLASGPVSDAVGNVASSIDSSDSFKIDYTKPSLSPSVSPNPVQLNGSAVASANAADGNGSGIASSNCGSVISSSVGTKSVSCSAADIAGNTNSASANYSVVYGSGFGGILQPINGGLTTSLTTNQSDTAFGDDNSRVKLGSTVPVKFQLKDANNALVSDAVARLHVRKLDSTPDAGVDETLPIVTSTAGNLFRYDATSGQYIFNLSTKNTHTNPNGTTVTFTQGTYNLAVLLEDGTLRSFNFNILK